MHEDMSKTQGELPLAPDADNHGNAHAATPTLQRAMMRRQFTGLGVAAAALLWGTWATHTIIDLRHSAIHVRKVQLAALVGEYVQAEARTGAAPDQITAETATFLKALNTAVASHSGNGEILLLSNAVVGGDVPDLTADVRQEVYRQLPPLRSGQPQGISPQVPQMFNPNGAAGGTGK